MIANKINRINSESIKIDKDKKEIYIKLFLSTMT